MQRKPLNKPPTIHRFHPFPPPPQGTHIHNPRPRHRHPIALTSILAIQDVQVNKYHALLSSQDRRDLLEDETDDLAIRTETGEGVCEFDAAGGKVAGAEGQGP